MPLKNVGLLPVFACFQPRNRQKRRVFLSKSHHHTSFSAELLHVFCEIKPKTIEKAHVFTLDTHRNTSKAPRFSRPKPHESREFRLVIGQPDPSIDVDPLPGHTIHTLDLARTRDALDLIQLLSGAIANRSDHRFILRLFANHAVPNSVNRLPPVLGSASRARKKTRLNFLLRQNFLNRY